MTTMISSALAPQRIPATQPAASHGVAVASPHALLPAPTPMNGSAALDAMSMMYLSLSKLSSSEATASQERVRAAQVSGQLALKDHLAALQKEQDDANKGTIFDEVSKSTGLLGAIGLATFCPTIVAADLLIHESGLEKALHIDAEDNIMIAAAIGGGGIVAVAAVGTIAVRKADFLNDAAHSIGLGGVMDFIRKDHIGVTDEQVRPAMEYLWAADMAVASIVASAATFGAGTPLILAVVSVALSAAAIAAEKTKCMDGITGQGSSENWALGLRIASAVVGAASAAAGSAAAGSATAAGTEASKKAAEEATKQAKQAAEGISAVNGASLAIKGADKIQRAVYQHDADEDAVQAESSLQITKRHQRMVDTLIQGMKEAKDSHQHALDALRGAIDTNNQALLGAATMRV